MRYYIRAISKERDDVSHCVRWNAWLVSGRDTPTYIDSVKKAIRVLKTSKGLKRYSTWWEFEIIELHDDGFEQKVWPITTLGEALTALGGAGT